MICISHEKYSLHALIMSVFLSSNYFYTIQSCILRPQRTLICTINTHNTQTKMLFFLKKRIFFVVNHSSIPEFSRIGTDSISIFIASQISTSEIVEIVDHREREVVCFGSSWKGIAIVFSESSSNGISRKN